MYKNNSKLKNGPKLIPKMEKVPKWMKISQNEKLFYGPKMDTNWSQIERKIHKIQNSCLRTFVSKWT